MNGDLLKKVSGVWVKQGNILSPTQVAYTQTAPPDAPPAQPTQWDDEFDGPTLNAIWTDVNGGGTTFRNSRLCFDNLAGGGARAFYQTCPATPWEFTAKFGGTLAMANYATMGITLYDTTGGKASQAILQYNGSLSWIASRSTLSGSTLTWSSNPGSYPASSYSSSTFVYIRVKHDGTNIKYSFSVDGLSFFTFWTEAATAWLTTAPSKIGFSISNGSTAGSSFSIDWFRRTDLYTYVPVTPTPAVVANSAPDAPPQNPTQWDDEFTGTSLNSTLWTLVNPLSNMTVSLSQGTVNLVTTSNATDSQSGIYQTLPSGDWEYTTKVAVSGNPTGTTGQALAGLAVRDNTGKASAILRAYQPNASGSGVAYPYTTLGVVHTGVGWPTIVKSASLEGWMYLRAKNSGGNLIFLFSRDGINFTEISREANTSFLANLSTIGIMVENLNTTNPWSATVDWFRRTDNYTPLSSTLPVVTDTFTVNGTGVVAATGAALLPYPDTPPTKPSVYDDEFAASFLSSKWTVTNTGYTLSFDAASWLRMTSTTNCSFGFTQAFADPTGDFNLALKVGAGVVNSYVDFCIGNGASPGSEVFFRFGVSGSYMLQAAYRSSGSYTSIGNVTPVTETLYLVLQRRGGKWDYFYSTNGVVFRPMYRDQNQVTFTPTVLTLRGVTAGTTIQDMLMIDWIRYNYYPIL